MVKIRAYMVNIWSIYEHLAVDVLDDLLHRLHLHDLLEGAYMVNI